MAELFGKRYTSRQLLAKVGDIRQIAGAELLTCEEGKARGVRLIRVRTGGGLAFDIAPDRSLDIIGATYRDVPIAWQTPAGIASPQFHEPEELGFLRTFPGGLVVTCGLNYFGAPCEDGDEKLGLHGRISHEPARDVSIRQEWVGNEYVIVVSGVVRQYRLFGENLQLTRSITTTAGANSLMIEDQVTNCGFTSVPHMILYHCNFGFPLVDEGAEIVLAERSCKARDDWANKGFAKRRKIEPPQAGRPEQCYFYDLGCDSRKNTVVGIVNRKFEDCGIAAFLSFNKKELPNLTEWKNMAAGDYVIGLEPCNCPMKLRAELRRSKELPMLKPGQTALYTLEVGVLEGARALRELAAHIKRLK